MAESKESKLPYLVRVAVKKGEDLAIRDRNSSDPYCKVYLGEETKQTRIIDKNLNPVWNEQFDFYCKARPDKIRFKVKDHDALGKDEDMGEISLPLLDMWLKATNFDGPLTLQNVEKGKIYVSIELVTRQEFMSSSEYDEMTQMQSKILLKSYFGIPVTYWIVGGVAFTLLVLGLGFGIAAVCNLVAFSIPLYYSMKAISSFGKDDDTEWLIYWVGFGFLAFIETTAKTLLSWIPNLPAIPFYHPFKLAVLLIACLPQTQGAKKVYKYIIAPWLQKSEKAIDERILKMEVYRDQLWANWKAQITRYLPFLPKLVELALSLFAKKEPKPSEVLAGDLKKKQ